MGAAGRAALTVVFGPVGELMNCVTRCPTVNEDLAAMWNGIAATRRATELLVPVKVEEHGKGSPGLLLKSRVDLPLQLCRAVDACIRI